MATEKSKRLRLTLYTLAALLAAFVYSYGLDSRNLPSNGDEYVYAHITRLTAASGHLLPLQSNLDHMRNTKPPLGFWQGIVSTVWGQHWTLQQLRYPSVIYTLLTALLIFLLARKLSQRIETGFIALLCWLAFFSTYRYGRPFLINAPETFWLFLPFFILLYWQPKSFASRLMPLMLGSVIGIGLLYKSFALALPVGLALAWWYLHQSHYRWRDFLRREIWKPALAITLALALFALWFVFDPDPQAVWREFILGENAGKFDPHGGSYFAKLLWGGSSVWSLALGFPLNAGLLAFPVAALFYVSWRRRAQLSEAEKLLWILPIIFFAVFSLPSQRSARYLFEAMPALAVLAALNWQRIPRWTFMLSLLLTASLLTLLGYLAVHLQRETGGELYAAGYWLLLSISIVIGLAALFPAGLTRPLTLLSVLLCYLVFTMSLRPFDGKLGSYDAAAIQAVQGKPVWVPCNFRAQDEGYRFLLPGAEVHGYGDRAPAPAALTERWGFAVQLPVGVESAGASLPQPLSRILGQRLVIRSRQGGDEIKDMLRGNVYMHLFAQEWLIEAPAFVADAMPKEGCR
jgi:4-amino-4-deoxy-L-arabinose transferase-like glycosyltransferase